MSDKREAPQVLYVRWYDRGPIESAHITWSVEPIDPKALEYRRVPATGVPVEATDIALDNMRLRAELDNYRRTLDDLSTGTKSVMQERDFWKNVALNAKDELLRMLDSQHQEVE